MRKLIAIAAGVTVLALAGAASSAAADNVAFEAELHHFSLPQGTCDAGVCNFTGRGWAFSNLMGPLVRVYTTLTWDFNTTPCSTLDPLVFTLVGETGSITISGSGYDCPGPEANPQAIPEFFSYVGEVTDGTGEFSGITGSVTAEGTLGPNGPVVHMSGTVSY